jgi:phosphoribosyl 1,2-cyclic phosphodiesterase
VRVFVLGSGSSGNAVLVESHGTRVLIDAGVGPRVVVSRLAELGVELRAGDLHGIVASHDHGDHFGHAGKLATVFAAPLYLHGGIELPVGNSRPRPETLDAGSPPSSRRRRVSPEDEVESSAVIRRYEVGRAFRVGGMTVMTTQVPHDAAQVAIRIEDGISSLGIATDIGRVTPALVSLLGECDGAIVEANHCSEMLAFSDYPDVVKRRVGGGFGHLSNAQTAELASRLVGSRLARLWLGHLSRSNNTPARALEVVATRARRIDVDVLPAASPVALEVRSTRPYQLGLPFA